MEGNILGVDWGKKYVGMAYVNTRSDDMIMPIGYLMNDANFFFNMGDILERYKIAHVVVGYPKQHKDAQLAIDEFLQNISFVNDEITHEKVDEEYSSVQASAKTESYTKDEKEDTLAAMVLLENYLESKQSEH